MRRWSVIKERTLEMINEIAVRMIWCSAQLIDISQNLLSIRTTMPSGEHFRTNSIFCSRVSRSLLDSATSGGFHISATRMEEVRRITHFRKSCCKPSHVSFFENPVCNWCNCLKVYSVLIFSLRDVSADILHRNVRLWHSHLLSGDHESSMSHHESPIFLRLLVTISQ